MVGVRSYLHNEVSYEANYDSVHTAAASGDPDDGPDTDALLYGKWALSYKIASW